MDGTGSNKRARTREDEGDAAMELEEDEPVRDIEDLGSTPCIQFERRVIAFGGAMNRHLEPGKQYLWCSCGKSRSQPFCDGSHIGGRFVPIPFTVDVQQRLHSLCGCKYTRRPPWCDGSHIHLTQMIREEEHHLQFLEQRLSQGGGSNPQQQ